MSRQYKEIPGPGEGVSHDVRPPRSFTVSVDALEFTNGGGASGTYTCALAIPQGARILGIRVQVPIGFNDGDCTLQVGDGTDVDRYMTGTVDIADDAATGVDAGLPSGVLFHATAINPVLTATQASDWDFVTDGRVIVTFLYV
jgi:hypothetical protein